MLVALVGVAWALIVPPFQAPDELQHFAYSQSLATRMALPGNPKRALGFSTDESDAIGATGAANLAFQTGPVRANWNRQDFEHYLAVVRAQPPSQSDGGGSNPQAVNPPLYYLYSDLAYWVASSPNLFARLYAMQVWDIPLLLATVVGAWLLAGEVLGRRPTNQLLCAALAGLVPQETFVSTSVSVDALLIPLWTFALWLGARLIRRGWSTGNALALCAVTAAAIVTKATSYALLPGVAVALLLGWGWRQPGWRSRVPGALGALGALVAPVVAWIAITRSAGHPAVNAVGPPPGTQARPFNVRQFLSYLWQFYLPRLPSMRLFSFGPYPSAYPIWIKEGWADFGWLDVLLPPWLYPILGWGSLALGFAGAFLVFVGRRAHRWRLGMFFALVTGALLFGLHLTAYRSIIDGDGIFLQGRYLLPLIGLAGLCVGLIVGRLPRNLGRIAAGVVLAGLLLLQVIALATVAKIYYT